MREERRNLRPGLPERSLRKRQTPSQPARATMAFTILRSGLATRLAAAALSTRGIAAARARAGHVFLVPVFGLFVYERLSEFREPFIGFAFFIEGFLKELSRLLFADQSSPRADRAIAGDLVVLHFLGG